jgi:phospholipid/cholesterol/gamma-HCH transport system substrate-binding protein
MTGSIRWTAFKLAMFTVVTIIVTTWLASIIGNLQFFKSPYEISGEFTDATGVLNGDVVKAAGVTVGRVASIEIQDGVAVIKMTIQEDVELPAGLKAEIRFRNLVGQRMVNLVADEEASTTGLMAAGDVIPLERTAPAFDLSALFNGLRPLIRSTDPADINLVSRELVQALRGRSADVEGFLSNVSELSETLASKDEQIATMLDSLNTVTADLAGRDQQLQTTLGALNSFMGDLAASKDDLAVALRTLDDAATRFGRIIDRRDGDIEAELADLATIFDAVNDKRAQLRKAIRALPGFTIGVERVSNYGQWGNIHLIDVCKDDLGTCGRRWMP